jgi:hypothetical protein
MVTMLFFNMCFANLHIATIISVSIQANTILPKDELGMPDPQYTRRASVVVPL